MAMRRNMGESYHPLYFLSALGSGGLAVSFFIYLMFMVPHPKAPIPTFDVVWAFVQASPAHIQALIGLAAALIVFFAVNHYRLLIWNLREYAGFKHTEAYERLKSGNGEVALMAIPLTLAMSINVGFVLGALFVPGLWSVVEYLFPGALVAFGLVGLYGVRLFLDYFSRIIIEGRFHGSHNANLSQMISIFAFAMIGVGFAAPAAMSHVKATVAVGMILSILFLTGAAIFAVVKIVLSFKDILEHGIAREGSVSMWIVIPIMTVIGIALMRISHGLHATFDAHTTPVDSLVTLTVVFSMEMVFGAVGLVVMRKVGYFREYISGPGESVASYAIICPGVAFFVMGMFFLSVGLVQTGIVGKFSIAYFVLMAPLVFVQLQTIRTLFRLNGKLLRETEAKPAPVAAE